MTSFKVYPPIQSLLELNIDFNKVVRPIVFSNLLPGFKISDLSPVYVTYNFNFSTVLFSIINAQIYLEVSPDNNNWTILSQNTLITQTGPSIVALGLSSLTGLIPKGNYVRLRGQVDSNSSITYLDGTEYILTVTD